LKSKKKQQSGRDDDNDMEILDTLLVQQFRPPVGQATFEFPAGLIDKDETPEQAALRELKEETGYVGSTAAATPPTVSRNVCMSPGLADETVQVVVVNVDLDDPANDNPRAEPDAGEHITVHRVSLKDGFQSLLDKGTSPMAIQGLYLFALGLEIGKSMNKA
jgi:8-oxo-dGTP pyrophosphatase MutT (NUDIX family)